MELAREAERVVGDRHLAPRPPAPRNEKPVELLDLLVPHRIDRPLPYLVGDHRNRRLGIDVLVVIVGLAARLAASPAEAWIEVRDHEVVARRDGAGGGAHGEPPRVVLLVLHHPCVERLEVAVAEFVAERGGDHRGVVSIGVCNCLQLAPQPVVQRLVAASCEALLAPVLVPVAELAEDHHAKLVRRLERRLGRSPGVHLDRVHPVVALDGEEAHPFALRHVGMTGEREVAVVDVGAHEERTPVDHQAVALAAKSPEAKPLGHRIPPVAERDRVKPRVELVPRLRLLGERRRHEDAPSGVWRGLGLESREREIG